MAKRPVANIVDGVPVANVADIAYKAADGKIKVIAPDLWDSSLGTAVGVVVIPSGFAPDNGLARIVALKTLTPTQGWGANNKDTSNPNYTKVPTTYNTGLGADGYAESGVLPSDEFVGEEKSYVDPKAGYMLYSPFIPSPYLGDAPNPAYYVEISGGNALSDFNGYNNNINIFSDVYNGSAIEKARNYKVVGAEEIEWYLPAAGEAGYLIARLKVIQSSITKLGEVLIITTGNSGYWTSTESSYSGAFIWNPTIGAINKGGNKLNNLYVRPFAMLDF